ncbi:hypothetical protein GQX73_g8478 [Xylaria multiplex]|uniref:Uncharacterized protein n=1 Tax=Xylaria multiplex TaxID=323545 RepID=A0A7C8N2M9_9PEZI|nr:hypothetical protein GQX73_g8478 [Xylaria multiplex]
MKFAAAAIAFSIFLASAPLALANSIGNAVARQVPEHICESRFGAPIDAFYVGEECEGDAYACDISCREIIQCFNGVFVIIASCNTFTCAGNNNGGAICE